MKDYLQENGYKKTGKMYVPPILQLGEFNEVHWRDDILPELIWIGLLQSKFGLSLGSKLAYHITEFVNDLYIEKKWLAPISNFIQLTEKEKLDLINHISKLGYKSNYESAFKTICYFYPDFPLSFLVTNSSIENRETELTEFKNFVAGMYDRTNSMTTFIQATAVDIAFQADLLKVNSNTSLAQFPEISNYPSTEISLKVASSIRSTINMFIKNSNITKSNNDWSSYFWNRGLQLDNCY